MNWAGVVEMLLDIHVEMLSKVLVTGAQSSEKTLGLER